MIIYSVQNWRLEEGDWNTGKGYFAVDIADAEEELAHLEINYPDTTFRIAVTEINGWREVSR